LGRGRGGAIGSLPAVQPSLPGAVDARADRAAQAFIGVYLLAAFVFRLPWLVPIVVVAVGPAGLVGQKANPLLFVFDRFVAPRLKATDQTVDARTVQLQDLFIAGLAAIASLGLLLIAVFGWLVAVGAAVVAVLAASTGVHIGAVVLRRAMG
jgi:uncharacterized protein DUF4395